MGKRINPNLVKIHRNYTVEEIASVLAVHKNTVREWIKKGLQVIDCKRPVLIHGNELRQYLKDSQRRRKRTCKPDELFCLRCKTPQQPIGKMLDYEPMTETKGRLIGLCSSCEGVMNRYTSIAKLDELEDLFEITKLSNAKHIVKTS
ncbi:MAG: helix-turn-helix domain-containing protein [Gammaproteobacteria bacterium]|nr:helix-turn-helix domain-containing protein [Gammaproteobacteria bacterium]